MKYFAWIAVALCLSGCDKPQVDCNVRVGFEESTQGNAGCWIARGGQALMVRQRNGLYSFPGGTAEVGESAQCTAHRETYEEAGINTEVFGLHHQFENGFYLYYCEPPKNLSLKTLDKGEVDEVLWVKPQSIPADQWWFPKQRFKAMSWLRAAEESTTE